MIDRLGEVDANTRGADVRRVDDEVCCCGIEAARRAYVDAVSRTTCGRSRNIFLHEDRRRRAHRERDRRDEELVASGQRSALVDVEVDACRPPGARYRGHGDTVGAVTNI